MGPIMIKCLLIELIMIIQEHCEAPLVKALAKASIEEGLCSTFELKFMQTVEIP